MRWSVITCRISWQCSNKGSSHFPLLSIATCWDIYVYIFKYINCLPVRFPGYVSIYRDNSSVDPIVVDESSSLMQKGGFSERNVKMHKSTWYRFSDVGGRGADDEMMRGACRGHHQERRDWPAPSRLLPYVAALSPVLCDTAL